MYKESKVKEIPVLGFDSSFSILEDIKRFDCANVSDTTNILQLEYINAKYKAAIAVQKDLDEPRLHTRVAISLSCISINIFF
jgi:hypothetical protein